MFTYFLILNDYGIRPLAVWKMATFKSILPAENDVFDENAAPFWGNSNLMAAYRQKNPTGPVSLTIDEVYSSSWLDDYEAPVDDTGAVVELTKVRTLAWDHQRNSKVDIRLFYPSPF